MATRWTRFRIVGLTLALAAGCGDSFDVGADSTAVGGACSQQDDCDERCVNDTHYPGMCSMGCARDADCPSGSSCVDDLGGICAVACSRSSDCEPFGRAYTCDDTRRRGADGDAFVCRIQ